MPQVHEDHICSRCELECDCGGIPEGCPYCSLCNAEIEKWYDDNPDAGDEDDYPNDEWGV